MFKLAMALLGSAAVLAMPVAASAEAIDSPNGSHLVLEGDAWLNSNKCYLTLEADAVTANPYGGGINVTGTNVPNPAAVCSVIKITDGQFTVSSPTIAGYDADIDVSYLVIDVAGTSCTTSSFKAYAYNASSSEIGLDLPPTLTSCGLIEAYLISTSPTPVQIVP